MVTSRLKERSGWSIAAVSLGFLLLVFSLKASSSYALLLLFLVVFVGCFGTPGGLVLLISSGALAGDPEHLVLVMAVGFAATLMGDILVYEVARGFSGRALGWLRRLKSFRRDEEKITSRLMTSEFPLVFFSRWLVTSVGAPVAYISGFIRLDRRKYVLAVFFGELIFSAGYPLIGYLFRENYVSIALYISYLAGFIGFILVFAALAAIAIFLRRRSDARAKKSKTENRQQKS